MDGGTAGVGNGGAGSTAAPAPKRLYQIRDGAMISGLCNGIAAYFNVDPTFVRVAFVAAAIIEIAMFDRPPAVVIGLYAVLVLLCRTKTHSNAPQRRGVVSVPTRQPTRSVKAFPGAFGTTRTAKTKPTKGPRTALPD